MTAVLAQYLSSNQDQEINVNEKQSAHCTTSEEGGGGGGGTTRPLPRDGGAEELRGDPTVGPHPKVWTIDRE